MESTRARAERRADDPVSRPQEAEAGTIGDTRRRGPRKQQHDHDEAPGDPHRGKSLAAGSEDLGTVRRPQRPEEPARALKRTRLQLTDTAGVGELTEVEGPEVRGREICDIELEIGGRSRPRHPVSDPVAPLVPRTELVADIDHH